MNEIFADGIRSVTLANGVLRVELFRLRHGGAAENLEAEPAGVLLLPASSLKDVASQFSRTLEQLQQRTKAAAESRPGTGDQPDETSEIDAALG